MKMLGKKYIIEGRKSKICECDENECVIYFLPVGEIWVFLRSSVDEKKRKRMTKRNQHGMG